MAGARPRRRGADLLVVLAFVLPTAAVAATWAHGFRNPLADHDVWRSTKPTLARSLMGADAYTITPITLAGERLNLDVWHGFQEVLTAAPVAPRQVRFTAGLDEGAALAFVYGHTEAGFSGVRLSRSPHYQPIRFTAAPDGRFTSKEPLVMPELDGAPHQVLVDFDDGQVRVTLDGAAAASFAQASPPAGRLGFRGYRLPAWVDDVAITAADGAVIADEFSTRRSWRWAFAATMPVVLGLVFLLGWLVSRLRRRERLLVYALTANLVLLLLAILLVGADRLYLRGTHGYSVRHFRLMEALGALDTGIETVAEAVERLDAEVARAPATDGPRVLFLGSSQTWGAGASRPEAVLVDRVAAHLGEATGAPATAWLNTAISGRRVEHLAGYYEASWIRWQPDLVVVNLSNNDREPEVFREGLTRLARLNAERDIRTVFVAEPNVIATPRDTLPAMHAVMREVAAAEGVPVVELHQRLLEHHDEGFLWWDFVHLTDFGQDLAGAILAEALAPHLAAGASAAR